MNRLGVETRLNVLEHQIEQSNLVSGTSVILITPDGERTMNTNLGVSTNINLEYINEEVIGETKILYVEGYLYDTEESRKSIDKAIRIANNKNIKVALTLSDYFCVDRHREDFKNLFKQVDILFANEAEFCSLFEIKNQELSLEIIDEYKNHLPNITAITQSERGVSLISDSNSYSIDTLKVDTPKDLTGAGDQFAAGFLFGMINNFDIIKCGRYGMELATIIISKILKKCMTH